MRAKMPTFLNTDIPNRTDGQHEHIKIVCILCVSMNLAHKAHWEQSVIFHMKTVMTIAFYSTDRQWLL